jgi:hypothetical protein
VFAQGLVTVAGKSAFFAGWFVADPSGTNDDPQKQAWFTLQAEPIAAGSNRVSAKIYRTIGSARNTRLAPVGAEVGSAEIQFLSCDKLSLRYRFYSEEAVGAFFALEGTLGLDRVGACRQQNGFAYLLSRSQGLAACALNLAHATLRHQAARKLSGLCAQ